MVIPLKGLNKGYMKSSLHLFHGKYHENTQRTRQKSPTWPSFGVFVFFPSPPRGGGNRNSEVAHLRQRLLDTTSCDALADDEPMGKDAHPRWGEDPSLPSQVKIGVSQGHNQLIIWKK